MDDKKQHHSHSGGQHSHQDQKRQQQQQPGQQHSGNKGKMDEHGHRHDDEHRDGARREDHKK